MLARGSLATYHINVPMVDQNLSSSNFLVLYVRAAQYQLLCLGHWTALLIRNPAAYLLSVLVYIASKQYVDRLHNGDCYAHASIFTTH